MGSDVLSGREGVDYIYGEEGRDHLLAHASSAGLLEEDLYDGGTGHDKVDYTNAVLASGNGISIEVNSTGNGWAQAWNGASVSGLQDDLVSIEDVTLSGANDRFERTSRPTQFFAVIDGGDGSDTAVYTESSSGINDIVIDRRVTGETTIWDADGNGADRLLNFENVEVGGWSVVLPDASVSTGSGVYVNPDRDYVDYSGTTVAAVMVLNNDNTGMMNSSVTLGSVEHNLLTTRWSGVPTLHTQITGTNYGDTINIYSAQNGTKDGNYSSFRVITGAGDDTVYVDNAASEPTVTTGYDIRVTYTGGNDVYDFDVPISEIRLANTIMLSDVSVDILSSGGNSVTAELEIANHGTLTFSLSHISATSMSVRLETGGTITINTNGTYSTSGSSTAASVVEGTWGDDIWLGRSTAEAYYGKDGDDTINGGGGNDLLNGGAGDDTYVFGTNFSSSTAGDRITERDVNGGTDTIKFINAIDPDDMYLWTDSSGFLWFQYATSPSTHTLKVDGEHSYVTGISAYVERVEFDDSTVWDLTEGLHIKNNNTGRSLYGTSYDDIIEGGSGVDAIYGYFGDDVIEGHGGNDTLRGGLGDDTYVFGTNFSSSTTGDRVIEGSGEGFDTIRFVDAIDPDDMYMWTDSSGYLWFQYATSASTHTLKVDGAYSSVTGISTYVESVEFDDSTVWDLTEGLHIKNNNTGRGLYGSQYDDVIEGGSGNETIRGYGGDDILTGGAGNNNFYGGSGADTFWFKSGDLDATMDTIHDFSLAEGDKLDIADLLSAYDPLTDALADFVSIQNGGSYSFLRVDTDGTATGHGWEYLAYLPGAGGLNVNDMVDSGNLIVPT